MGGGYCGTSPNGLIVMNHDLLIQRLRVALIVIGVLNILGAFFVYPAGQALYSRTVFSHTEAYESLRETGAITETSEDIFPSRMLDGFEQRMWNGTVIVVGAFAVQGVILIGLAWRLGIRNDEQSPAQ